MTGRLAIPGVAQPGIDPGTYQARQQMLAEALQRSQGARPTDIAGQIGEAINQVGTSFMAGRNERAGRAERTSANKGAQTALAAALRGEPLDAKALDLLSNEWVDPQYQQIVGSLIAQQTKPGAEEDLVQAAGPDGKLIWVPKSQAAGMGSTAPKEPDPFKPNIEEFFQNGRKVKGYLDQNGQLVTVGDSAPLYAPQQGDGGPKTSLVPFYTTDAQGNVHMFQPTASGVPVEVQLPPGMSPTKPVQWLDTSTALVPVQPLGGQPAGAPIPKDVAGEAAANASGKLTGEAQVNLPGVRNNARVIKETIARIKNHPGRVAATGGSSVLNPVAMPGGERQDFLSQAKQLQGQAFLQAYEGLKGGGQITEVEGAKAEAAKVALDMAQSEGQYVQALDNFEREVDALVALAEQKAGSAPSPMAPQGATPPATGPTIVQTLPAGFQ